MEWCGEFVNRCWHIRTNDRRGERAERLFVLDRYADLYGRPAPEEMDWRLVKMRITSHLQWLGHKMLGKEAELKEGFLQNYRTLWMGAAERNDVRGLDGDVRALLLATDDNHKTQEGTEMKTTKTSELKKAEAVHAKAKAEGVKKTVERVAPASDKKAAAPVKKAAKKANGHKEIFGNSASSIVRLLGKLGANTATADAFLKKYGVTAAIPMIRTYLYAGKAGTRGAPAEVTAAQKKTIQEFIKSSSK